MLVVQWIKTKELQKKKNFFIVLLEIEVEYHFVLILI